MPDKVEMDGQKYLDGERKRLWGAVQFLNDRFEEVDDMGVQLLEIRIQGPAKTGGEYRAILKAQAEDGRPLVAFCNAGNLGALQAAMKTQADTRGIPWRDDKPYSPGG